MYTECPSCNTVFRVTATHLKIAHGKVRCGRCNSIFNALDSLVERNEPTSAPSQTAQEPTSKGVFANSAADSQALQDINIPGMEAPAATESPAIDGGLTDGSEGPLDFGPDGGIFSQAAAPTPDDAFTQDQVAAASTDDFGGLDLTADLAEGGAPAAVPADGGLNDLDFAAPENVATTPPTDDFGLGESPTADATPAAGVDNLDFDLGLDDAPPLAQADGATLEEQEIAQLMQEQPQPESLDFGTMGEAVQKSSEEDAEPESRERTTRKRKKGHPSDDYVLQELGESPSSSWGWLSTLFWTTLIIALLLVLLLQFAYFKRDELAKYPQLRPYLEQMCAVVSHYYDCEVPQPRDIHAIDLMDRDVRTHPNRKSALLITSTIVNKAEFTQPYPMLQITFSDINQKIVASREFKPTEYLSHDVNIADGMKSNVPVRMMIEIVDPGPEAVNFEFIFK